MKFKYIQVEYTDKDNIEEINIFRCIHDGWLCTEIKGNTVTYKVPMI